MTDHPDGPQRLSLTDVEADREDDLASSPPAPRNPSPTSPSKRRAWWFLIVAVLLLGGADQGTKQWAKTSLRGRHRGSLVLYRSSVFTAAMTFVKNPGAAWGLLARASERFRRPFFIILSLVSIAFVLYLFARLHPHQRFLMAALTLILAGALGNFVDRLHLGYVIDFIDLRFGRLRWATFNIADVAITLGVVGIFLEMLVATFRDYRRRRESI